MDFTEIIKEFQNVNVTMVKNLSDTSLRMIYYMILIDLTITFLFVEEEGMNIFIKLMRKILVYGFFLYLIRSFADIVDIILKGFIQLGNLSTLGTTSTELTVSPGVVFDDLSEFIKGILLISGSTVGLDAIPVVSIESVPTAVLIFTFLLAIGALFIGIEITVSFVKFFIVTATAIILMPFGAFKKTQDIALKGLHALFAQGIEIMFITIILNFYKKYRNNIFFPTDSIGEIGLFTSIYSLAIMILFVFMMNKIPSFVATLLSGSISALGITNTRTAQGLAGKAGAAAKEGKTSTMSNTVNSYTANTGGSEGVKNIGYKQ